MPKFNRAQADQWAKLSQNAALVSKFEKAIVDVMSANKRIKTHWGITKAILKQHPALLKGAENVYEYHAFTDIGPFAQAMTNLRKNGALQDYEQKRYPSGGSSYHAQYMQLNPAQTANRFMPQPVATPKKQSRSPSKPLTQESINKPRR